MINFINHRGRPTPIGVDKELYNVTWVRFWHWILEGSATVAEGHQPPEHYTDPGNGFMFRFPFPDDDNMVYNTEPHFITVDCSHDWFTRCDHHSDYPMDGNQIRIRYQKPMADGTLWTVVQCPQCLKTFHIDQAGALELCDFFAPPFIKDQYVRKLTKRIEDGYFVGQNLRYRLINSIGLADMKLFRALVEEILSKAEYIGKLRTGPRYYRIGGDYFVYQSYTQFQWTEQPPIHRLI